MAPPPVLSLRLKNDTGRTEAQRVDRHTSDATVVVDGLDPALFRWRLHTGDGAWRPGVGSEIANTLFPGDGPKSVGIQALDPQGKARGQEQSLEFVVDRTPPRLPGLKALSDLGVKVDMKGNLWVAGAGEKYTPISSADVHIVGVEPQGSWIYAAGAPDGKVGDFVNGPASDDRLPSSLLKPGPNTIYFNAFDLAGNSMAVAPSSPREFFFLQPPDFPDFWFLRPQVL